ncbi:MAG: hypothetical protein FWG16_03605, partial [Micrococcales bacterium]|nr:hypothetical protein [Micrococcales bacterium]
VGHGNLLSKRRFDSRNRCPTFFQQQKSMPNQVKTAQIDAQQPRWAWKSVVSWLRTTETAHR